MHTMRSITVALFLVLATAAPGQQPEQQSEPQSARQTPADRAAGELQRHLLATAAGGPTSFAAEWVWPAGVLRTTLAGAARPAPAPETASGAFAADELRLAFPDDKAPLELVQQGRHWLVREGDGPFRLASRAAKPIADRPFLPDPQLLLRALAQAAPRVLDRSIGERDGKPVERFALTLDADRIEALRFAGAIGDPNPVPDGLRALVEARGLHAHLLAPTVDVAVEIDVATKRVLRIHVRSLARQVDTTRLRAAAGGRGAGVDDATPPADDPEPVPTTFRDGLPVREQGDRQLRWLELRLAEHGTAQIEALDGPARALLGR